MEGRKCLGQTILACGQKSCCLKKAHVWVASLCVCLCGGDRAERKREISVEHIKSEGLNPLWLLSARVAPPPLCRTPRPHSSPLYPPLGTWICCTMVRSCTRNSLASLALSDNPFSAWESWLCGEKEGRPEMPSHRATWSYFKTMGSQTQEPLSLPSVLLFGSLR